MKGGSPNRHLAPYSTGWNSAEYDGPPARFEQLTDQVDNQWLETTIDVNWMTGGRASLSGFEGDALNMLGVGVTLGIHINENLQLTMGYMASVNDGGPTDLRMDSLKFSLVFGWHPLIEGVNRLGEP